MNDCGWWRRGARSGPGPESGSGLADGRSLWRTDRASWTLTSSLGKCVRRKAATKGNLSKGMTVSDSLGKISLAIWWLDWKDQGTGAERPWLSVAWRDSSR